MVNSACWEAFFFKGEKFHQKNNIINLNWNIRQPLVILGSSCHLGRKGNALLPRWWWLLFFTKRNLSCCSQWTPGAQCTESGALSRECDSKSMSKNKPATTRWRQDPLESRTILVLNFWFIHQIKKQTKTKKPLPSWRSGKDKGVGWVMDNEWKLK